MKWPSSVTIIRHGESAYNALKEKRKQADYIAFGKECDEALAAAVDDTWASEELQKKARILWKQFALDVSDYDTSLTDIGWEQARATGVALAREEATVPDVVYVSPYLRTRQTLEGLSDRWKELQSVRVVTEERIREQEHGLSTIYNDKRVFQVLNPEQALLFKLEGGHEYRLPNGENKADVRARLRSFFDTMIRKHATQHVLLVSHHITLLSFRAAMERWDRKTFMDTEKTDRPVNCGVTVYRGNPARGERGKLVLESYNTKHYE